MQIEVDEDLLIKAAARMDGLRNDHLKPITPEERENAMKDPAEVVADALGFVLSRWSG